MIIEAAVAGAILLAVAVANAGGGPGRADPSALAGWGRAGVPSITSLIDDLRAIETDTAHPGAATPPALARDQARLLTDLATAERLPTPPGATVAAGWRQTLVELAGAGRTLRAAATSDDPATIVVAHQRFELAGNGLLAVGQAVQATG
jgi:hypothetical protein